MGTTSSRDVLVCSTSLTSAAARCMPSGTKGNIRFSASPGIFVRRMPRKNNYRHWKCATNCARIIRTSTQFHHRTPRSRLEAKKQVTLDWIPIQSSGFRTFCGPWNMKAAPLIRRTAVDTEVGWGKLQQAFTVLTRRGILFGQAGNTTERSHF